MAALGAAVNNRDRELVGRIATVVSGLTGMTPNNPADIKALASCHQARSEVLRPLWLALSDLQFGDLDGTAKEHVADAEEALAKHRSETL